MVTGGCWAVAGAGRAAQGEVDGELLVVVGSALSRKEFDSWASSSVVCVTYS